jgi:hypothetical protein
MSEGPSNETRRFTFGNAIFTDIASLNDDARRGASPEHAAIGCDGDVCGFGFAGGGIEGLGAIP